MDAKDTVVPDVIQAIDNVAQHQPHHASETGSQTRAPVPAAYYGRLRPCFRGSHHADMRVTRYQPAIGWPMNPKLAQNESPCLVWLPASD
jgi:hypothetical protein